MKARKESKRERSLAGSESKMKPTSRPRFTALDWFALASGLFLELLIVKFGNPVILESKISPPASASEFWQYAWPPRWSLWLLVPLTLAGAWLAIIHRPRWPGTRWLYAL